MSTIVTLTDSAKEHMTTMLKENSKKAVRLALKGGGCAGFKYDWSLEDSVADEDEVVDFGQGKFIVDPASVMYLLGSTIDYKKEVFGSYFTVSNPASTSSCGCGESIGF
jgi:iron-sulfur cluster assembly accessory protein|tara:strand:- start:402 stop:728 length:327 start_codon:yes stop_codon:yes gene_type:complete